MREGGNGGMRKSLWRSLIPSFPHSLIPELPDPTLY
jgi:hypothetical protein